MQTQKLQYQNIINIIIYLPELPYTIMTAYVMHKDADADGK